MYLFLPGFSVRPGKGKWCNLKSMSDKPQHYLDGPIAQEAKPQLQKPVLFKVILLNDDYTPMEFVVEILERFFAKNREDATRIMIHVHQKGMGICGVYTREIAETKVRLVMDYAREQHHPLQCTMEPE
jgi:ATP-dependent Clp protease adaptor protein ClpS